MMPARQRYPAARGLCCTTWGDPIGTQKMLQILDGLLIELYYIPNSTAARVLVNNPNNGPLAG